MNKFVLRTSVLALSGLFLLNCSKAKFYAKQKEQTLSSSSIFDNTTDVSLGDGVSGSIPADGGNGDGATGDIPTSGGTNGTDGSIPTTGGTNGTGGSIPTAGSTNGTGGSIPTTNGGTGTATPVTPDFNDADPNLIVTVNNYNYVVNDLPQHPFYGEPEDSHNLHGGTALPTYNLCSNDVTSKAGTNVGAAFALQLRVYNEAGALVCKITDTATMKSQIQNHYLSVKACNLPNGQYSMVLADNSNHTLSHATEFDMNNGTIVNGNTVRVIADYHEANTLKYKGYPCDISASPLYIDFRSSVDYEFLSSPENGVWFDILGANNTPAYTPSKISWFTEGKMALLALPDQNGQVRNIDQLFGDNTKGPDGSFAANGFLALAKFDSNADGMIDSNDPVFSSLRLWFDKNSDGVASPRELLTLAQKGVVSLDLNYDPNFAERDQYGNEILFKSVVNLRNGKMKPMFDVWFKLSP